jgi:prevent-host-death family protein
MTRWRPSEDIRPVTEFRANASAVLDQLRSTQRPVILTQNGRSAAVLLGVSAYEELVEELALLRDIKTAEAQAARGQVRSHAVTAKRLRSKLVK